MANKQKDYVLGVSDYELERLRFQHTVWKEVTDSFFDKIGVKKGCKILDVGSGPVFVAFDLMKRIGNSGEITALEPSEMYLNYFKDESEKKQWTNTKAILGSVETAELPENYYELIFARWVIGFVPDPGLFLDKLVKSLAPGGIIAIMDYAYDALALYPKGGTFDNMEETVRQYWRHGGGDPYIAAALPKMFKERNIELTTYQPVIQAGGPSSGVYRWADRFFMVHIQQMVDIGVVSQSQGDAMLKDWIEHKENPDSIFFSPVIVNVAGRKP
jgi:ubiquinone/menaquinone biosynthesis C-methylase UbiE